MDCGNAIALKEQAKFLVEEFDLPIHSVCLFVHLQLHDEDGWNIDGFMDEYEVKPSELVALQNVCKEVIHNESLPQSHPSCIYVANLFAQYMDILLWFASSWQHMY